MKKILLSIILVILLTVSVFAEEHIPYFIYNLNGHDIAMQTDDYSEYLEEYQARQTTQTLCNLPYGNTIVIDTKGVFRSHDAISLCPEYIKIKESEAGSLKKGDSIYFYIDKGTFLKNVVLLTQGNIKASAIGEGNRIKLEIQEESTEASEITLSHIIIMAGGENKSSTEKKEFCLSAKYVSDNFTKEMVLNPRFATMEWNNVMCIEHSFPYFEGQLSFQNGSSNFILNDNTFSSLQPTYKKQNYLMVPIRSLVHGIMLNNIYATQYQYNEAKAREYTTFEWNAENQSSIMKYGFGITTFQSGSNIVTIEYSKDDIRKIILPVAIEMKNNTLYIPLSTSALRIFFPYDVSTYWDITTETIYIEV